jgi:hypothetical protein
MQHDFRLVRAGCAGPLASIGERDRRQHADNERREYSHHGCRPFEYDRFNAIATIAPCRHQRHDERIRQKWLHDGAPNLEGRSPTRGVAGKSRKIDFDRGRATSTPATTD